MKYDKMVCLVNEREKQMFLNENSKGINLLFPEDDKKFISELNGSVFPVISINNDAENSYNIISSFPNLRFYILFQEVGESALPPQSMLFLHEKNVSPESKRRSVFSVNELIALFEGQDIVD